MAVSNETDLQLFLIGQREQIKKQIECKNYDTDLEDQMILWNMYSCISNNIRNNL